jgi:hypothetical protein
MGGFAIGTDFRNGYPGSIARSGDEVSRSRAVKSDSDNIAFGDPVVVNTDGTVSRFGASNTAADFAGIAMRKVKQATGVSDANFGVYYPLDVCDVLERGSVSVVCKSGTAQAGGAVYIRTVAGLSGEAVGDIEASGTTTGETPTHIVLTNAKFAGAKDSNGVVEMIIVTRQGV